MALRVTAWLQEDFFLDYCFALKGSAKIQPIGQGGSSRDLNMAIDETGMFYTRRLGSPVGSPCLLNH